MEHGREALEAASTPSLKTTALSHEQLERSAPPHKPDRLLLVGQATGVQPAYAKIVAAVAAVEPLR
jgi:hypothetical protein